MLIRRDDIVLQRLKQDDIELVRQHRNSPDISQYMEYRKYITPEMQQLWFESINNLHNLYFLIIYKGKKIGLANGKNVNWEKRVIEGGIFLWEKKYLRSPVPVYVFIILSELLIYAFNLSSIAHVLKTNSWAKRYNKMLGFELCEGQEGKVNQLYRLTKEKFEKRGKKLINAFMLMKKDSSTEIILENHDYEDGSAELIERQLDHEYIKEVKETPEGKIFRF